MVGRSLSERPNVEVSAIAVYRDTADVLRFSRFRHRNGQYAILECGCRFVLLDVLQRYAPFETAVVPFAETACLVFRFRFLLAGDRKNAVCDFQTDVFLIEPGQLGGDTHLPGSSMSIWGQPSLPSALALSPKGVRSKPRNTSSNIRFISRCNAKNGWMSVAALEADLAASVVPGNEILD